MSPEIQDVLEVLCKSIDKKYGTNTLCKLTAETKPLLEEVTRTGSISLDTALGIGGYKKGRIIEIFGPNASGKTTASLHAITNSQREGNNPVFVDLEHCIAKNTLIYNALTNRYEYIQDLINQEIEVISVNKEKKLFTQKGKVIKTGEKKVFTILSEYGNQITLTEDHKILTETGFKKVKDIKIGEIIFSPKFIPSNIIKNNYKFKDINDFRLLGLHLGDGTIKKPEISTIDNEIEKDIKEIIKKYNCVTTRSITTLRIVNKERLNGHPYKINKEELENLLNQNLTLEEIAYYYKIGTDTIKNHILKLFPEINFNFRKRASCTRNKKRRKILERREEGLNRFSKNEIYYFLEQFECFHKHSKERFLPENLTTEQLKQVLAGLFLADGTSVDSNNQHRASCSFSTASYRLAKDIQASLLRLNIFSTLSSVKKEQYDLGYIVTINNIYNIEKFLQLPIYGDKRKRLERAIKSVKKCNRQKTDKDLIKIKVKEIKEKEVQEVYDINTQNTEYVCQNFLAEGIFIHNCFDPLYATNLKVDLDKLLVTQPEAAEDALDIVEMCAKTPGIGLIVVDSVSALVPRAELEGEMSDQNIGLQARLMSKAMRKLVGSCNRTNTTIIFLNQLRSTISSFGYGPKETTGGGAALKYYSSQRLDIRSIGKIKQGEDIIGNRTRVKVVKNKLASPFKQAEFDIVFGKGIDSDGELIDLATEDKIIVKSGAWYKYKDESIAQGRPNAIYWLNENPELKEQIRQEILNNRGLGK